MKFLSITGFGHHLAKRLEKHGYTVYAGVLYPEGEGARSLSDVGSDKMFVLPMDVTSDIQVKGAAEQVRSLADDNGKKQVRSLADDKGKKQVRSLADDKGKKDRAQLKQVRLLADDKGKKDHVQLNKYAHWRIIRVRKTAYS